MTLTQAVMVHWATATSDDVSIARSDSMPYRASEAALYVALVNHLIGEHGAAFAPLIAVEVGRVLAETGPEPVQDLISYAVERVMYRQEDDDV